MSQSPTYWSDRIARRTHLPHLFCAYGARGVPRKRSSRSTVAAVAVRGWFWKWQRENRGDGTAGGMVVTRTGHCHPRGYRRYSPPMQNHPLSRSMGNYFLSVDYGVNFRTTRPDHFERDTAPVRDTVGKGSCTNTVARFTYPAPDYQQPFDQVIINPLKVNTRSSILSFFSS